MKIFLLAGLSFMAIAGMNKTMTPAMNATEFVAAPIIQTTAANLVLASGNFVTVDQEHATTGMARIIEENGQRYLEFDSDFDTARGPAVQVVLYKGNVAPVKLAKGDYVTIGNLKTFEGKQRYMIPSSVNLDNYGSVAIWCEQFNVTFGYVSI